MTSITAATKENRIYIRVEFTRKKSKTAILLYCFHTAGVLHIFLLYNLLGPGISLLELRILVLYKKDLITATFSIKFKVIRPPPPLINTPEMSDVCLSFVLLFTIFIFVVTQKLVIQQSKNVTAKWTETLSPLSFYSIFPCKFLLHHFI